METANRNTDIHISNQGDNRQLYLSSVSKLHFLSLVDVASIPLYLVVGPSLEVCFHSQTTQQWIENSMFPTKDNELDPKYPEDSWWVRASGQLERGILLKVEDEASNGTQGTQNVTELLLYATVSVAAHGKTTLPIPTCSSPPNGSATASLPDIDASAVWKIYALPLSSQLLRRAAIVESPSAEISNGAQFLAPPTEDDVDDQRLPYKRKKMTSLFENATQQRKRLKRRGGDGISKAMATYDTYPPTFQHVEKLQTADSLVEASESRPAARASLQRASSTVSTSNLEPSRPSSRRETFINGKRTSVRRVESLSLPRESSCVSECNSSIEQQNKTALTRIVMAGMRVHGLQQRKRSNKPHGNNELPPGDLETQLPNTLTEDDGEYKLVYHQTFRAACFAFRLHIATTLFTLEALREVVDRLLAIFCTDPLIVDGFGGTSSNMTETVCKIESPFDPPSTNNYTVGLPKIENGFPVESHLLKGPMPAIYPNCTVLRSGG